MKPKLLLLLACFGAASAATGAILAKGSAKPIENAYGNDAKQTYTMVLNCETNALFRNGYGVGTASTATPSNQSSVGFESFMFDASAGSAQIPEGEMHGQGENTFTLVAGRNTQHSMLANTEPFSSITSVTVKYTYDSDRAMDTLYIYGSNAQITSIPSEGGEVLRSNSGSAMLENKGYHYFAIAASGSTTSDAIYHVGISSIEIEYTC